jgi:hypothetical protein
MRTKEEEAIHIIGHENLERRVQAFRTGECLVQEAKTQTATATSETHE